MQYIEYAENLEFKPIQIKVYSQSREAKRVQKRKERYSKKYQAYLDSGMSEAEAKLWITRQMRSEGLI